MGRKFQTGDHVRVAIDAVGSAQHPRGARAGDIGTVMHYYGGGTTPLVYVKFPDGFVGCFSEAHLEPAQ